jgi:transcriptional regulator with XRE-family HTH domain
VKTPKTLDELYKGMNNNDRQIIRKGKDLLMMEADVLATLRKHQKLTQTELAQILEVRQAAISQIENGDDVLVKTLQRYIAALGGTLEVRAKFPDHIVTLTQFSQLKN